MEMSSINKDLEARRRIVSEIDRNFFVEAGAGSGKTSMLVQRMVAMVEAGLPIEKISAITFTKAAAGEFYERFQDFLIRRSNPAASAEGQDPSILLGKPTETSVERCRKALENVDLCFMGTIDSFCNMVLSEHPYEAEIPSDARLITKEEEEYIYRKAYERICAGNYGRELAIKADAFQSLHKNAVNVFVEGISVLMEKRNVFFEYDKCPIVDVEEQYSNVKTVILDALRYLRDPENQHLRYIDNKDSREAWDGLDQQYKVLQKNWNTSFVQVMDSIKALRKLLVVGEALPEHEEQLGAFLEAGGPKGSWYCIAKGLHEVFQSYQYSVSMQFLESCVPLLEEIMRDQGCMTYFDYLYYLRQMLKKDAEKGGRLIHHIYNRHSYFLIDEFQDTNPMQAEIFFYLCGENTDANWQNCVPRQGSLFIVGDMNQSIYRFRGADVDSFCRIRELFQKNGSDVLTLTQNFRSGKELCEFYNSSFEEMLSDEIPVPEGSDDDFRGIYKYTAYTGKLEKRHPEFTDPKQIARIIESLVDRDEYQILVKENGESVKRRIGYRDIMVITLKKSPLKQILAAFDEKGIPARAEGEVTFGSCDAFRAIVQIYSAVSDTSDAISLYGALTGKIFGVTSDELIRYRSCGGKLTLNMGEDDADSFDPACREVVSVLNNLKKLHKKIRKFSPAALYSAILDEFRIYEIAKAERLEMVSYALELLRGAEKSGLIVSLEDGASYLNHLLSGDSDEERCLNLNPQSDQVHVANLHKVKGLEAPIVILAAATTKFNDPEIRIERNKENGDATGRIFSVSETIKGSSISITHFSTVKSDDEKELVKKDNEQELQRLIYVAATRARNALFICDSIVATRASKANPDGGEKKSTIWGPLMKQDLPDILDVLADEQASADTKMIATETVDPSALYDMAEENIIDQFRREQESATYELMNPSRLKLASKMSDQSVTDPNTVIDDDPDADADDAPVRKDDKVKEPRGLSALRGTMIHRLMETLVSSRNSVKLEEAVPEIISEYMTPDMKPYEQELSDALMGAAGTMRSGGYIQSNGLPQDLLTILLNADEVYCEVPFSYLDEPSQPAGSKKLWNGIIDVIYRDGEVWHIVDYKTNADGNDLDWKYQEQMKAYEKAFHTITGENADAKTYHIDV